MLSSRWTRPFDGTQGERVRLGEGTPPRSVRSTPCLRRGRLFDPAQGERNPHPWGWIPPRFLGGRLGSGMTGKGVGYTVGGLGVGVSFCGGRTAKWPVRLTTS